jgi:predicted Mrr-cat superfamily restriction endonuclease
VKTKKSNETRIWGIRAGKNGSADALFLKSNLVALEDDQMGDLSKIDNDRESYKKFYLDLHLEADPGGGANIAGKFFRFCREITDGDFVVYYRLSDRKYYIATVIGKYNFLPEKHPSFPHVRKVHWIGSFEKSQLSISAQRELGAARTFFKISRHSDELAVQINKIKQANSASTT